MRSKHSQPLTLSALALYDKKNELKIPEVQRDLVWTKSQKQLLIDSLFKDYDIPKIYFEDITTEEGKAFNVIDGQQRINAILSFLKDDFAMPKDSDEVDGEAVANKYFSELSSELQIEFNSRSLDVVHLVDYSREEIDETFLRLQNGTPLKAAEKRRAIAGEMRNVVKELSQNSYFDNCCDFDNSHYNYEDITVKVLKQIKEGAGSLTAQSLSRFYEQNPSITVNDPDCKKVKAVFNFLTRAFKNTPNPHLKKYAAMDLAVIANGMLGTYDLKSYPKEFAKVYLSFLDERAINSEKEEDDQDPKLVAYSGAARGDSLELVEYRQNYLRDYFIENMPYLVVKDKQRTFTPEQRAAIYRLGNGVCAVCGKQVDENSDYHADHIEPWSKGGQTKIANGQLLCAKCNLEKSDKTE